MQPLRDAMIRSLAARAEALASWHAEGTDCYRLLHGAVEGAPGLAIDRYGPVLLAQTWREPLPDGALPELVALASEAVGAELVGVWNHRGSKPVDFERFHPLPEPVAAVGRELGVAYDVSPRHRGQDPLLFLDLRVARRRLLAEARGRSVLNLFAYTCGVGVAAAVGGATEVWNVDFARSALEVGRHNAELDGVAGVQRFVREDVFPVMRQLAGLRVGRRGRFLRLQARTFDMVVLDPPRWSTSRYGAVDLVGDYASLFKPAVLCAAPGGVVVATNNVASVEREAWVAELERCARKAGRPLTSIEPLDPEVDFPSPDGRPPLKIAWCRVS